MPNWAIYDVSTNRVKDWVTSSPIDPVYPVGAGEGAIKDPNVSLVLALPLRYWKQSGGTIVAMTQGEKDQVDADIVAASIAQERSSGIALLSANNGIVQRALADIFKDEINILRQWLVDFKGDVAAATTLADLKTRVAANADLPDRTLAQLRTALENRMNSGNVDA